MTVSPNGCCSEEECCCDIVWETCVSVRDTYKQWLDWNHCNSDLSFDSLAQVLRGKITCATATPEDHGCDVITAMCLHGDVSHSMWAHHFPLAKEVCVHACARSVELS